MASQRRPHTIQYLKLNWLHADIIGRLILTYGLVLTSPTSSTSLEKLEF